MNECLASYRQMEKWISKNVDWHVKDTLLSYAQQSQNIETAWY